MAQLTAWNPVLGAPDGHNCSTQFWAGYDYCVGTVRADASSSSAAHSSTSQVSSTGTSVTAPGPTQSGIVASCNQYLMANDGGTCTAFASRAGISLPQLYAWNSVLGPNGENCGTQFWGQEYYCVGVSQTSVSSSSTTTSITAPGPTQSGIIASCTKYLMANDGGTCTAFASQAGISLTQLYAWNTILGPIGENCGTQFWGQEYYCVGVSQTSGSPTSSKPSSTTTSITAPGPTQSGIVSNCNTFLMANPGGSCSVFASRAGISASQLYAWNPILGSNGENCASQFWGNEYYCVGVSQSSVTPTSKSTAPATTSITAPGPTQTGISKKCIKFLMANPGGSCSVFASRAGITTAQLYAWNTVLGQNGENCATQFWGNEYYCVGVSG
jgi:LysM repeat protein